MKPNILLNDPYELNNLWEDPSKQSLKKELLLHFLLFELGKEILPMERVSHA